MTLTSKPLAVLIVLVLLGGILFSSAMGWWQTESRKVAATFEEGEYAGQSNPADIRGSYTFGDVEKNFGVPAEVLAQAFGVQDENSAAFQVKNLETLYAESETEIGTSSVRLFVAFYNGLPFDLTIDIYLPSQAVELLAGRDLSPERQAYLESHTKPVSGTGGPAQEPALKPEAESTAGVSSTQAAGTSERLIKGKTTFSEILGWGISQAAVEGILGLPVSDLNLTVKDFCSANGLNFETIKSALQAEVDKAP